MLSGRSRAHAASGQSINPAGASSAQAVASDYLITPCWLSVASYPPTQVHPLRLLFMAGDMLLQFVWPPEESGHDIRTVQIKLITEGGTPADIYKVCCPTCVRRRPPSLELTVTSVVLCSFTIRI